MLRFRCRIYLLALLLLVLVHVTIQVKKQRNVVTDVHDIKDFKKLLRTKTNILVLFVNSPKSAKRVSDVFKDTADVMKGQATLVLLECTSSDDKKLCKKLKSDANKGHDIKHYKDGEFHKNYDRSETVSAMSNFLRDPSGDLPWEEDPQAAGIYHIQDGESLSRYLKKSGAAQKKTMILFYAPWCGYCKVLKPEYIEAAADLKGEAWLAAIDMAKPGNSKLRQTYNITGFPTILFYDKGKLEFPYSGENKKQAIVDFMRNPTSQPVMKKQEADESWSDDSDVVHLSSENFDSVISKIDNALVVFYAPWCGHCKYIKPEYEKAASKVKDQYKNWILAAVDATKGSGLANRFGVKGYPTLKYFSKGEFKFDVAHARKENQLVDFVKDPQEPPPPPPPEKPWSEEESYVRHLRPDNFRSSLKKATHAMVMFYAPWCGHCKSTKPEFVKAAEQFADELMVLFGAVDCTVSQDLCQSYGVKGYPSIKYYSHFDKVVKEYDGGRKEDDFVSFIKREMTNGQLFQKVNANQKLGFGRNVYVSTDADFEDIISVPTPTFVMFFASWCVLCAESKPAFSKISTELLGNSKLRAIAIDASENQKAADIGGVELLPTFKMFRDGHEVGEYNGDRSYEDLVNFINKYKSRDEL